MKMNFIDQSDVIESTTARKIIFFLYINVEHQFLIFV